MTEMGGGEGLSRATVNCQRMAEMGEGSVYADHIGSVPKPTKKTWLEKANLLPTVQAALRCVLAVVVASLAQAPPLLPILFALFTCEGVNIYSNFQVEVLPEKNYAYC